MKCKEIIRFLEQVAPPCYAEKWDNIGLLVGDSEKEIHTIFLAVDATDRVIEEACQKGADMLVTHHPLIFSGMKSVNEEDFIGRRVRRLVKEDICYYAMHTNFDIVGDMAGLVVNKLPFKETEVLHKTVQEYGLGRIGNLCQPVFVKQFVEIVKEKLKLPNVILYGDKEKIIERVAIMPGSGDSEIGEAIRQGAELMVTGDIGHHDGIDALAQGLMIIDAGHYGLEKVFVEHMEHMLNEEWNGCIQIETEQIRLPFIMV